MIQKLTSGLLRDKHGCQSLGFSFLYINFPPMFLGSQSGFNITRDLNSGGGMEGLTKL